MKSLSLGLMFALFALCTAGHAESVYKLKDAAGETVYSDRPDLPGTTDLGKVELPPGPTAAEQQAAKERLQHMEQESDEMQQSRMEKEKQRAIEATKETKDVGNIESVGQDVDYDRRRDNLKVRIPTESPTGGEHPVYQSRPPAHAMPRPSPGAIRR